jgi:hypothetical protein
MSDSGDARPSGVVARDYITNQGLRKTGATCDSCNWSLTIKDILEKIEESAYTDYSPEYIRRNFGIQAEGHAFFNRGHKTCSTHLTVDEIEQALEGVDCYA